MLDEDYMKQALRLARRGLGKTSPNPMVGAVIVKDNRIIGQGYHHYFGGKHAEINAMENAREAVAGRPCMSLWNPAAITARRHPVLTPSSRTKSAGSSWGHWTPTRKVNGKGVEILRQHGIEVRVGVLEEECRSLNEAHFKYMTTGVPLVRVKFAQTLDGRIATSTGDSQWISSPASRRLAHKLRSLHDAVMVGIGTILADNPQLTVRLVKGRNPTRIVLDSRLKIPLDAGGVKESGSRTHDYSDHLRRR